MNQNYNKYIDEYQNVHIQDETLGQGGQGVVFRTKDPDLAIKLVTDQTGNPVTDEKSVKRYSKRFKRVRLMPLPERLNISVPAALLQNHAGYVMRLLSEMVPFSYFWLDGKSAKKIIPDDIPNWLLPEDPKEKENILKKENDIKLLKELVHYRNTGGLRRRLHAFYKCASLLARLHGNGMVYGDISPNNIFISEGLDNSSVWLIDTDNIRFEIAKGGSIVYTPKYGAPELVQGKDGGRPTSDCHAFAVVAFYLLSLIHPFFGKKVDGTDESDWADEENDDEDIEDKVYAGFFPWVDDQNDDSNSSESGLPRSLLLTEKLTALFEATFGKGRENPWLRPTIYHWPEAFAQAADMTVKCPNCAMSYYYVYNEAGKYKCPYCKTSRPQLLTLESYIWNGENKPLRKPLWRFVREISEKSEISIPRRVLDEFTMTESDNEEVKFVIDNNSILIKKTGTEQLNLSIAVSTTSDNNFQKLYSQIKIERTAPDVQFWMFAHLNSPRLVKCIISGGGK